MGWNEITGMKQKSGTLRDGDQSLADDLQILTDLITSLSTSSWCVVSVRFCRASPSGCYTLVVVSEFPPSL